MADVFRILKPGNGWAQFAETELLEGDDSCIPESSALAKVTPLGAYCLIASSRN